MIPYAMNMLIFSLLSFDILPDHVIRVMSHLYNMTSKNLPIFFASGSLFFRGQYSSILSALPCISLLLVFKLLNMSFNHDELHVCHIGWNFNLAK